MTVHKSKWSETYVATHRIKMVNGNYGTVFFSAPTRIMAISKALQYIHK